MQEKEAQALWDRYKTGKTSPEEELAIQNWFHSVNLDNRFELSEAELETLHSEMVARVMEHVEKPAPIYRTLLARMAWTVAASLFLILLAGLFLSRPWRPSVEAAPGGDKAYLTLADGRKIDLNKIKSGQVTRLDGVNIVKTKDNQLIYTVTEAATPALAHSYNILSTPAGGQFQVILPDGTRVWMNASSSLSYPTAFSNKERRVVLNGEAYFEVAHEASRPFRVEAGNQEVEVFGTHFNINAYRDEPYTITTLAEGSVAVTCAGKNQVIVPGEQAVSNNESQSMLVRQANLKTQLAWKNGMIAFQKATLPQIMRAVARWYDLKVIFDGPIKDDVYTGGIARDANLSVLLDILEANNINFKLEEAQNGAKSLIVTP